MDVIVASAPPAVQALQQATGTIPIVMIAVAETLPVSSREASYKSHLLTQAWMQSSAKRRSAMYLN